MPAVSKKQQKYFGYLLSNPEERKKKGISKKAAKDFAQDIQEVSPPGWGHTKAEKEKTKPNKPKSKIGGSAAAFKRALDDGRFKGLPGDKTKKEKTASMFKLMWSMKNKGDKPHYKPGTDEKKKKYQEETHIDENVGTGKARRAKMGNIQTRTRGAVSNTERDVEFKKNKVRDQAKDRETASKVDVSGLSPADAYIKKKQAERKAEKLRIKSAKHNNIKGGVKWKYQEESAAVDANTKLRDQKKRDKMAKQLARLMIHARDQKKNPVLANSHEVEGELIEGKKKGLDGKACWKGYKLDGTKKKGGKTVDNCVKVEEGAAWTKKAGKNPEGGLNEKGRKSYEKANPGSDLKAPQPEGGSRKKSFCARMGGMKKKLTSSKTANDPDSRINKSLRKWKCNEDTSMQDNNLFGDAYATLKKKVGSKKKHDKPAVEEGIMQMVKRAVKKKEERKPEKAMDAGARARRKLARAHHAKYVSGSEDLVPDSIRETVDDLEQDNSKQNNTERQDAIANQIKSKENRQKMIKKQVLLKKLQAVRAGAAADITASYKPEGEVVSEGKGISFENFRKK